MKGVEQNPEKPRSDTLKPTAKHTKEPKFQKGWLINILDSYEQSTTQIHIEYILLKKTCMKLHYMKVK